MLRALAGGSLFGEVWGASPCRVVALHGWGRTHADFARVFGPPSDPLDVLALDLPGFGATPPPAEPWGSADYAAALERLFDAPDGGTANGTANSAAKGNAVASPSSVRAPVVVVGHSFGGRVAVQLAATRPELVAGLVLTGVPLLPAPGRRRRPPIGYRVVRAARRARLVGEEPLERARRRYGSTDYVNAQGVMRGVLVKVLGERYDEQLEKLQQLPGPVELVWSDDDTEAPMAVAEQVVGRLPRAVLTRCGPVGHLTPLTAPEMLRAAVARALVGSSG
ncbi:MAG TPA: alpha/beta hydrolase [Acidimicrobiales bacterium]|nr:alpha/beta hydrolase [Acidimicrobiales bacterium]